MIEGQGHRSADLAALRWLIELGADEAIGDFSIDRYALPQAPARKATQGEPAQTGAAAPVAPLSVTMSIAVNADAPARLAAESDAQAGLVAAAVALAAGCNSLEALRAAIEGFEGCALKKGARSTVFADGKPAAHVMIIGEAPGRDEDACGRPFVGAAGQMLDRMLGAIGLARDHEDLARACYITNLMPWRPPQNREPSADEAAMMAPFVLRHIELAAPKLLVLLGNVPARALTGAKSGITRLRGTWVTLSNRPALHMLHPAGLLHNPGNKGHAWADLLVLNDKLKGLGRG